VFMLTKSVGLCNVEMLINLNLLKERAFKIWNLQFLNKK
jgi:hypothetical protein